MGTGFKIVLIVFLVMSIVAFAAYGIDKWKAVRGHWRISEAALLLLALLGGATGALAGMQCFRHKTQKMKFKVLVPLFLVLQIVLLVFLFMRGV